MEALCNCQKILLELGTREKDLNNQIWPRIRGGTINWASTKSALDRLTKGGLALRTERKVEGNRLATFYTLTSAGQAEKLLLLSGEKENNGTGFIFEGSCCLKQAV